MARRWFLALVLCTAPGRAGLAQCARFTPIVRTLTLPAMPLDVALDPESGHALVSFFGSIKAAPDAGGVYTIDVRRGLLLRSVTLPDHPNSIAVAEGGNRGFVATISGFATVDTRTGALLRHRHQSLWPGGEVIADQQGRVAYIAGSRWLDVLDAYSGRVLRTIARPLRYTSEVQAGAQMFLTLDELAR